MVCRSNWELELVTESQLGKVQMKPPNINLIWFNFLFGQTLEIVTFKETNELLYFFWVGGFFDSSLGNDVNHAEHSNHQ